MNLRFLTLVVGLVAGLFSRTALAQVTAPSQGGEVNVVSTTATTIELSFGTYGSGQGRVIAVALAGPGGLPVSLAATDGQFYTANAVYGQGTPLDQGYAVYNGADHSVIVTGLKPSTRYFFTDAEYNIEGAAIIYNVKGNSMVTATRTASTIPTPLPVELIAFTGTIDGRGAAQLHWSTATEHNSAYFAIEQSSDSTAFVEVDRVVAVGNSTQALNYQWLGTQRLTQPTYYRLQQVDRDGVVNYSSVVSLSPKPYVVRQLEVYPNPSAGQPMQLLLQGFEDAYLTLRLTDALGRPITTQLLSPAEPYFLASLSLPQGLAAGTYLITLVGSGSPVQKRIVVSN